MPCRNGKPYASTVSEVSDIQININIKPNCILKFKKQIQ